jgi:UDP-hydrolysing UDP-N-acetyl-D-glucosamine 2-epimerase
MAVPIAHVHGGEVTTGALDDNCRHAITKLSALHFVSTEVYRARVIQMGESPDRVFTVGAPFADELLQTERLPEATVGRQLGLSIEHPLALVAYHPATREDTDPGDVTQGILDAVAHHCRTVVVTAPNADPGWQRIAEVSRRFAEANDRVKVHKNLGSALMHSLMTVADVMVGNSSAGIHEAITFDLPAVNVGSRQAGRLRPSNVIDCQSDRAAIAEAVAEALRRPRLAAGTRGRSPFGSGHAAENIVRTLERYAPFGAGLLIKSFCDGDAVNAEIDRWNREERR